MKMKMKIFKAIFIFIGFLAFSQNKEEGLKVTYEYSTGFRPVGNFDTHLYIADGKSQYVHHQKNAVFTTEKGYRVTFPHFLYINNYNFNSKKVEENRILKEGVTLYAEWENNIKWEITNEEKVIDGYKARKAVAKSFEIDEDDDEYYYGNAIAWFTEDVPYSTGPGRYYGLPGLILELHYANSKNAYKVKSIEKINLSNDDFKELDKQNKVDDKEDVIYFFHKNPSKIKKILKNKK